MLILIDNGHGEDTPGKCSPDRRLLEYKYCREIARRLSRELTNRGAEDVRLLVPGNADMALRERVRRVNGFCDKYGAKNVLLVSIHNNAAGSDRRWHDARGFSVFVSKNASQRSRKLAAAFTDRAIAMGLRGNRSIPKEKYWVQSLAMTRDTHCPAVLTENLFQDNRDDVEFLLSEVGKETIVKLHADVIMEYLSNE